MQGPVNVLPQCEAVLLSLLPVAKATYSMPNFSSRYRS